MSYILNKKNFLKQNENRINYYNNLRWGLITILILKQSVFVQSQISNTFFNLIDMNNTVAKLQ